MQEVVRNQAGRCASEMDAKFRDVNFNEQGNDANGACQDKDGRQHHEDSNNNCSQSYNQSAKQRESKQYVDIDPLSLRGRLSPTLVFICTVIYSLMPLASMICTFTLIYSLFTPFYPLALGYIAYILYDRNAPNKGGRRIESVYRSMFWTYLAAYFPIKLRHSTKFKLDPKSNYILNYSPHGISAFGCVTTFGTNGLNFSELFPGITSRFMVHETSFTVPIMRETFAFRGDCSVNSKSIDHMLSSRGQGNLLAIVVGGLAEADLSDEDTLKIVVAERKGFVKKSLIHGAHLIPCIAFGENSVFHKVNLKPSSLAYKLEKKWYSLFKFKHPIYYGRSILSESFSGIVPFKRPITVVMGDPIEVVRNQRPTQGDIDDLHVKYLAELRDLYEANQDLCRKFDTKLELL